MLEALTGKVFATIASLSMFLFSTYTGNDPSLRNLHSRVGENYLVLRTSLAGAFENDFPDVLKSGTLIPINFHVVIKQKNRTLVQRNFQNSVRYDPAKGVYNVSIQGMNRNLQTESYAQMLSEISLFECSIPYERAWGDVSVSVEAYLPAVRFEQLKKTVDLMVLWRYHKPKISASLNLRKSS